MDDKEITVHIRSPSLNETLQVQIALNETVLTLKKSVESIHPQHPTVSNQRIIYSGRLLDDSDSLNTILKKMEEGDTPTFHLVVKPSLQSSQKPLSQAQSSSMGDNVPLFTPSQSTTSQTTIPQTTAPQTTTPQVIPMTSTNHNIPLNPPPLPGGYQIVAINGQYYLAPVLMLSQPFMQQPQPYVQQPQQFVQQPQQFVQQPQQFVQQPQQFVQQPQQFVQQPQQFVQQPLPFMQQQAGPANPVNQQQRRQPILGGLNGLIERQRGTSILLAIKLIIVLFMLCQGASIERIIVLHTIALVFFLYQTGRLRVVIRRVRVEDLNNNNNNNNQGVQPPAVPNNNNNNNNNNAAEGSSTAVNNNNNNLNQRQPQQNESADEVPSNPTETTSAETVQQRPTTTLDVLKRATFAFFASLWPTYGVDPRIAQAFENENNNE